MKMQKAWSGLAAVALAAATLACENTAQGVKQDAKENAAATEQKTAEAAAATRDERGQLKEAAGNAGQAIGSAADKAGDAIAGAAKDAKDNVAAGADNAAPGIDAKQQVLDVKTALSADKSVDASHIDVDGDGSTRTLHLKGTVPTASMKVEAEKIAKAKAPGYTIMNMLTVGKK